MNTPQLCCLGHVYITDDKIVAYISLVYRTLNIPGKICKNVEEALDYIRDVCPDNGYISDINIRDRRTNGSMTARCIGWKNKQENNVGKTGD
jgi:hypothetical protein